MDWFLGEVLFSIQACPGFTQLLVFFSPNICAGKLPEHVEPRSIWMTKVRRAMAETLRLIAMAATHFLMKTYQIICI